LCLFLVLFFHGKKLFFLPSVLLSSSLTMLNKAEMRRRRQSVEEEKREEEAWEEQRVGELARKSCESERKLVLNLTRIFASKDALNRLCYELDTFSTDISKLIFDLVQQIHMANLASPSTLVLIGAHCGRLFELCLSLLLVTLRVGTPATSPFDVRLAWLEKLPVELFSVPRLRALLSDWHLPRSSLVIMGLLSPTFSTLCDSDEHVHNGTASGGGGDASAYSSASKQRRSMDAASSNASTTSSSPFSSSSSSKRQQHRRCKSGGAAMSTDSATLAGDFLLPRAVDVARGLDELVSVLHNFGELQGLLQQCVANFCGPPPIGSKQYSKLCCFSIDGKCARGEGQCPYAHSYEQIRDYRISIDEQDAADQQLLVEQQQQQQQHQYSPPQPIEAAGRFQVPNKPLPAPPGAAKSDTGPHNGRLLLRGDAESPRGYSFDLNSTISSIFDDETPPNSPPAHVGAPHRYSFGGQQQHRGVGESPLDAGRFERNSWPARPPSVDSIWQPPHPQQQQQQQFGGGEPEQFGFAPMPPGGGGHGSEQQLHGAGNNAGGDHQSPQRRKTQICRHWRRSYCRLGNQCNFAHGREDLAPFVRTIGSLPPSLPAVPPPTPRRQFVPHQL
jgi:Zinc finger C-x8-C-x5-C-x3-H type (and similar)